MDVQAVQPWYREPWPWLLMSGPAVVVVAGIITAVIAFRTSDGVVAGDYYKQGLLINRQIAREQRAGVLGLAARVEYDIAAARMQVTLSADPGAPPLPPTLLLRAIHPTRAESDRAVTLAMDATGHYAGEIALGESTHWQLLLETPDWRLAVDRFSPAGK